MARKPIDETVTDLAGTTQNIAEVLATVSDLTRAARAAAELSIQLYAIAERMDNLLNRLAAPAKRKPSMSGSSESGSPDDHQQA